MVSSFIWHSSNFTKSGYIYQNKELTLVQYYWLIYRFCLCFTWAIKNFLNYRAFQIRDQCRSWLQCHNDTWSLTSRNSTGQRVVYGLFIYFNIPLSLHEIILSDFLLWPTLLLALPLWVGPLSWYGCARVWNFRAERLDSPW